MAFIKRTALLALAAVLVVGLLGVASPVTTASAKATSTTGIANDELSDSAYREYGGVNFWGYCRNWSFHGAELIQWTAGGWRCYWDLPRGFRLYHDINATEACRFT